MHRFFLGIAYCLRLWGAEVFAGFTSRALLTIILLPVMIGLCSVMLGEEKLHAGTSSMVSRIKEKELS